MNKFKIEKQYIHKRSKLWLLVLIIPLLITTVAGGTAWWYQDSVKSVSSSTEEVIITIQPGATVLDIANLLEEKKLIKSSLAFDLYTRINQQRNSLQAGTYSISPSYDVKQIIEKIIRGDIVTNLVTILPGQRLDQIKASMLTYGYTQNEIEEAFEPAQYSAHPALVDKPASSSLEGYLYPESFQKTAETKLTDIITASLDQTALVLAPDLIAKIQAKGLTIHQAVILASIVEKEVDNSDDRPIVAQVFLKRYSIGMQLGSDITAFYGAEIAGLESSVFADTPYNTRLYEGLPPGPVSNISQNSLLAVAEPAQTDYLYFVSGDDGKTYFSNTLEEHEALTAQHCKELCE